MGVLTLDGGLILVRTSQIFWTRNMKKQDIHDGYPARIDYKGLSAALPAYLLCQINVYARHSCESMYLLMLCILQECVQSSEDQVRHYTH
jgi:hypothetical protein